MKSMCIDTKLSTTLLILLLIIIDINSFYFNFGFVIKTVLHHIFLGGITTHTAGMCVCVGVFPPYRHIVETVLVWRYGGGVLVPSI